MTQAYETPENENVFSDLGIWTVPLNLLEPAYSGGTGSARQGPGDHHSDGLMSRTAIGVEG